MTEGSRAGARLDQIATRYTEERDKRAHASRSYASLTGNLAHYLDDPHTPATQREPVNRHLDVIIIGGGLTGLTVAADLRKAGVRRIGILDSAGDFGGVWYWNRYPGAMCDIESYIYMPLLEDLGYVPSERYAHAPEILGHLQRIGRHFDLYDDALFQTTVSTAAWDADASRWSINTDRNDQLTAQFVVLANGYLSRPQIPELPGIEQFAGHSFHTSRWDYGYTGGSGDGGMDRLGDKVVGVVGTAASAIQCIPHLARDSKHLYVFQRTPSTVGVRDNRPTDPSWAATLKPGWQEDRRRNFAETVEGYPVDVDLIDDGWTRAARRVPKRSALGAEGERLTPEQRTIADLALMDDLRGRVAEIVKDASTAEALKPYYAYFCKRPGFHDEYLQTFNRDNVTLVDTQGKGLERMVTEGAVVDGTVFPIDCLVFATGFDATATVPRTQFPVTGVDGVTLNEKWKDGVSTLNGLFSGGFPNLFIVPFPFSGHGAVPLNYTHLAVNVAATVAHVVQTLEQRSLQVFDVDAAAEAAWVEKIIELNPVDTEYLRACTPGRDNNEGRVDDVPRQNANYGGGALAYYDVLRRWRDAGDLAGLLVRASASSDDLREEAKVRR